MEFNTILLFIITCVITIYFLWNYYNNRNPLSNSKQANDIRYYELKSKYEFLVAVVSFGVAVAVFYGLGTKNQIEDNLKAEFSKQLAATKKSATETQNKVNQIDTRLKNAQAAINTYYNVLNQIDHKQQELFSKQKDFGDLTTKANNDVNKVKGRVDSLNKKNLKRNFYLVDNLKTKYYADKVFDQQEKIIINYDTLTTTYGDKLPKFKKPPVIVPISDVGLTLHVYEVTTTTFRIFVEPQWFEIPKNGIIGMRLIITEVE